MREELTFVIWYVKICTAHYKEKRTIWKQKKRNKKQNEFFKIDEIILLIMEMKRKQSIFVDT